MNIIMIVGDGLRTLNLGCYGHAKNTTPAIDDLARRGVLFEDAYSCTNHTDPSFTTMLTGKHPISHGIVHHGSTSHGVTKEELEVFRKTDTALLPEILKPYGYYNMAFDWLGRWHKKGYDFYGETEGFTFTSELEKALNRLPPRLDRYLKMKLHRAGIALPSRSGQHYTDLAIKFIKRKYKENFFMLLHNWDTHTPFSVLPSSYTHKFYNGQDGERIEDMLSRIENDKWREIARNYHLQDIKYVDEIPAFYDGAVNFFDHSVERLLNCLEKLGIVEDTIIVITGDHGDNAIRDGVFVGHFGLYEPVIHVPLILYGPGLPRGRRIKGFVQHTDIVPTLLELLNVSFDKSILDGESLLPMITNGEASQRSSVLVQDAAARIRFAIRTRKYKYIYSPTPDESIVEFDTIGNRCPEELYDLEEDQSERRNIVSEKSDTANQLRERLLRSIQELEHRRTELMKANELRRMRKKVGHVKSANKV